MPRLLLQQDMTMTRIAGCQILFDSRGESSYQNTPRDQVVYSSCRGIGHPLEGAMAFLKAANTLWEPQATCTINCQEYKALRRNTTKYTSKYLLLSGVEVLRYSPSAAFVQLRHVRPSNQLKQHAIVR